MNYLPACTNSENGEVTVMAEWWGVSQFFLLMLIEVGEYPFKATKAIDRIVVTFLAYFWQRRWTKLELHLCFFSAS